MKAERLLALAASVAVSAVFACAACAQPRTAESAAAGSTEGDGGELTCDERARAQSVCTTALHQRCESLGNQCDLGCGPPGGNMPTSAADPLGDSAPDIATFRTGQCRDSCRSTRDACVSSIARRCPVPCQ